jgi:hypothetical protein
MATRVLLLWIAYVLVGVAEAGLPLGARLRKIGDTHSHVYRLTDLAVGVGYFLLAVLIWPVVAWQERQKK